MVMLSDRAQLVVRYPLRFGMRVLRSFVRNKGMLLAAAVAYQTLLSLIPILALTAIGLSQWFEHELVMNAARGFLELIAPTQTDMILVQLETFMSQWKVIGLVGGVSLLFFSALAFSALENALGVIFTTNDAISRREAWISFLLPYAFVLIIGFSIFSLTLFIGFFETLSSYGIDQWLPASVFLAALTGFFGEILLFTAIYYLLPRAHVALKHAFIGGIAAAVLWEIMRRLLVWYLANLSSVNVIYGTFATVLIIVLSLEVAVTILLFGAQIIREYGDLEKQSIDNK